jgi:hypothetical protein
MPTPHEEARAVVEQMYSAIGLARSLGVPPIDVDGLLSWAATLDAYLTLLENEAGWDCGWCGHRHSGRRFAYICVGCACDQRPPHARTPAA